MSIRKSPTVLVVDDDAEGRAAMLKVIAGGQKHAGRRLG